MKKLTAAFAVVAAGGMLVSGCWGGSGSDEANLATSTAETSTPSNTAEPTAPETAEPQADLEPGVSDAIADWVAAEQSSEYVGPCPLGDAPADTIGKWCHLPSPLVEAGRIAVGVGAVASDNVWTVVLERGVGSAWVVVSAEKFGAI